MNIQDTVIIAKAKSKDSSLLIDLEASAFGERAWPNQAIGDSFSQSGVLVYIAFHSQTTPNETTQRFAEHTLANNPTHLDESNIDKRNPCGFLVWRHFTGQGEILSLGVVPHMRQHGIASKLLHRLHQHGHEMNISSFFLEVAHNNTAALALYARAGYHKIGQRENYYRDGSHAIVMSRPNDLKVCNF